MLEATTEGTEMGGWGWLFVLTGGVLIAVAVGIDTSVSVYSRTSLYGTPDSVHNLGLMQTQMMVFIGGLASTLAGVVLLAAAAVADEMRRAREAGAATDTRTEPPTPAPAPAPTPPPPHLPAEIHDRDESSEAGSVERTVGIWTMIALVLTVLFFAYALGYLGGGNAVTNQVKMNSIGDLPTGNSGGP